MSILERLASQKSELKRVGYLYKKRTFPPVIIDEENHAGECYICCNASGYGCTIPDHIQRDIEGYIIWCDFEKIPKCNRCDSSDDVEYVRTLGEYLCYECRTSREREFSLD